jgi:hypothetical protein
LEAIRSAKLDTRSLLQTAHAHTIRWLTREQEAMKSNEFEGGLEGYEAWLSKIIDQSNRLAANTYWLRVGFGGGWKAMTGDWLGDVLVNNSEQLLKVYVKIRSKENYRGLPMPKSRRLTTDYEPLGLVEITLLDTPPKEGLIPNFRPQTPGRATDKTSAQPASGSPAQPAPQSASTLDQSKSKSDHSNEPASNAYGPKFKDGQEVVAQVIRMEGMNAVATIPLVGGNQQEVSFRYPSGLPVGQMVKLTIKGVNKAGTQFQSVAFKSKA